MVIVVGQENSIANQFLSELRDLQIQQDPLRFRFNMQRLGQIMAYEISRKLEYTNREVQSPLGKSLTQVPGTQPVLITIMRAGLPFFTGFQDFFDRADCGFIGAYRKEEGQALTIQLDYLATPSLEGRTIILADPMLATGKSVTDAVDQLVKHGKPRYLHLASVIASPEGIQHLQNTVKLPHSIWTFAVDEKLNQQYYIVPGLGDAGDLSFGPKL